MPKGWGGLQASELRDHLGQIDRIGLRHVCDVEVHKDVVDDRWAQSLRAEQLCRGNELCVIECRSLLFCSGQIFCAISWVNEAVAAFDWREMESYTGCRWTGETWVISNHQRGNMPTPQSGKRHAKRSLPLRRRHHGTLCAIRPTGELSNDDRTRMLCNCLLECVTSPLIALCSSTKNRGGHGHRSRWTTSPPAQDQGILCLQSSS